MSIKGNRLRVAKIKERIEVRVHSGIKGIMKSATEGRRSPGKYYVSIRMETAETVSSKKGVEKGSNQKRAIKLVAMLHEKLSGRRHDYLHKVSDSIATHYERMCVKDLLLSGMIRNRMLSRLIIDGSWEGKSVIF